MYKACNFKEGLKRISQLFVSPSSILAILMLIENPKTLLINSQISIDKSATSSSFHEEWEKPFNCNRRLSQALFRSQEEHYLGYGQSASKAG